VDIMHYRGKYSLEPLNVKHLDRYIRPYLAAVECKSIHYMEGRSRRGEKTRA